MELLTSVAILVLCSIVLGSICKKLNLPPLLGMIIIGIVLGTLNLISPSLLVISKDLRQIALVVILTRAGLSLKFGELKKNGWNAILLCFLPALFEMVAYVFLGVYLLKMDIISSAILGSVLAAVSPAIVIPRMLALQENGYGKKQGIPQLITAAASVDDVFVIALFSALIPLAINEGSLDFNLVWQVPFSIVFGIVVGFIVGLLLVKLFKLLHMRDSVKVLIMLCISFLFIALENLIPIPYAALLSVMSMGTAIYAKDAPRSIRLSAKYSKIWILAEIFLFVLVGAMVDITVLLNDFGFLVLAIFLALIIRGMGVFISLIGSKLNLKEKLFCTLAFTPKATVQAAIGSIPLSLALLHGQTILTAAVLSILITAPIGAFLIEFSSKYLLEKSN